MSREILKMVSGVVLVLLGILWYFVRVPVLSDVLGSGGVVPFWRAFLLVFAALFGVMLLLTGAVIAWLGYDDYRERSVQ
ncbi:MAG: hypothetical protein GXN98_01485 [Euryarchaeota archaeon]|nr:hypothetical protein [Euryarchaeota archaeon]